MLDLPVAYAFSAGMLACVNPCGAAMLPAWVSYYLGRGEPGAADAAIASRAARGLVAGLVATLGFVLLFSAIGLVVVLGGRMILAAAPWAAVAVGAALVLVGIATFLGRAPHLVIPGAAGLPGPGAGWRGAFLFGLGYGIASLSCTLPIFLVVLGIALAAGGFVGSMALFLSYSLGLGVVLTGVTLTTVLFKTAITGLLRTVAPYIEPVSAVALVAAGVYLIVSRLPYALS